MLDARISGLPEPRVTLFLVANRSGARFFQSHGGVKHFRYLDEISNPEGRLKNHQIESDRSGMTMGEGDADFPVHGLINKDSAKASRMQRFGRELARLLERQRRKNEFTELVLVAEPRFVGEILRWMDARTETRIVSVLEEDLSSLDTESLKDHLKKHLVFRAAS